MVSTSSRGKRSQGDKMWANAPSSSQFLTWNQIHLWSVGPPIGFLVYQLLPAASYLPLEESQHFSFYMNYLDQSHFPVLSPGWV
jgi:hypothetical protein